LKSKGAIFGKNQSRIGDNMNNTNHFSTPVPKDNLTEPQFLYKYYSFNKYTEKIFTHNEIYFPTPNEFNDPFDSKIKLSYEGTKKKWKEYLLQALERRIPDLTKEQRLAEVDRIIEEGRYKQIPDNISYSFLDKIGVFCMSEKKDHILMWSHYSASHTGFCLEFNATNEFFGRYQKIIYKLNYPKVNYFKSTQWEKTKTSLLTKAFFWKYEQEWRIIEHRKGPRVYIFPKELLTGVIFGCSILQENRTKILKWCSDRKHRPNLYQARVKKREFGLDILEIDY